MDIKIAKIWTTALRSGKYKQCSGALNNGAGFCCLGVLTDLYIDETKDGEWSDEGYLLDEVDGYRNYENEELPAKVAKWAGMHATGGEIDGGKWSLAEYNDGRQTSDPRFDNLEKHSFKEIADIIDLHVGAL